MGKLNTQTREFFVLVPWHDKTPSLGWCREAFDPGCYNVLSEDEAKRRFREEILLSVGYKNTPTEPKMLELIKMLSEGEDNLYVIE